MCEKSLVTSIIFYVYMFVWLGIPIIYLIAYRIYSSNRKVYIRAIKYALLMAVILYIPKLIGFFVPNTCYNCAMNNICLLKENEVNDDKEEEPVMNEQYSNEEVPTTTAVQQNNQEEVKDKTSKGFIIENINGVTYVDGLLIANKTYPLPSDFVPTNTYKDAKGYTGVCNDCIDKVAYEEWKLMKADALAVGLNLWIQSGYRPYVLQQKLYNGYVNRDGKAEADRYSARAGYSEHQSGLCFDINNPSRSFNGTIEAKWINDNAYKYGFIIRYPQNKENETGYMYESWHVRYVGRELAEKLYNNGDWITLESYLGITSEYAD